MARRAPSKEVYIKEISEEGARYAVAGTVVSFDASRGEGILDDGTGTLKFVLDNIIYAERVKEGSFVRLLGRAYVTEEGVVLRAEVVNELNVTPEIYNRVKELERRVYHEGSI